MNDSNKGKLYSALIIVVLVLALVATVLVGESRQAKLKEDNLKLAEKIAESQDKDNSKIDEDISTTSPDNISDNNDEEEEEEILVYSTENINVRSGPGTNYSILGSLPANEKVPLIEKRSDGWSKILFNGEEAFCTSSYLKEEDI
ncbi:SH3 domain-containing protein [Alloiococcus sp. CFN-8]|uniref:SH3 domain-containing protein n=1 Tax=Alloiococcus sp. CFN-8 TaxID=3416081 RepID=UPI003CF33091